MHFPYNCDSDSNYFALEKKYPTGLVPVVCKLNKKNRRNLPPRPATLNERGRLREGKSSFFI